MSNILIAGKGYIYTDGITHGHTSALGTCDSAENRYEITEAEHKKILKEKMEASK